jgi:TPR repeat protein
MKRALARPTNGELFLPLVAGWPAFVEDRIAEDDAALLMHAAAGWDIFFLCPDRALAGFERAAAKGNAIAAYNAALMRLERNADGDRAAALALLERAAALGDARSKLRLRTGRE